MQSHTNDDEHDDCNSDIDVECLISDGKEVCWQDWDSGGPGGGAGRISVYRYNDAFYVLHDAGVEGPYSTKSEAVRHNGVAQRTDATVAIWDEVEGFLFTS